MVDHGITQTSSDTSQLTVSLTRREFAAMAGGAMVAAGLATPIMAAVGPVGANLNRYEGPYAIDSHKVVDGYFVAPRGQTRLDVVLVIPGPHSTPAQVRAAADRQAQAGAYAVAPRVTGAPADIRDTARRLQRLGQGNGVVRIVTA